MKIFIWNNPYNVSYGGSYLFVVAETEDQARELAKTTPIIPYGFGTPLKLLGNIIELGPPTRVLDAPNGECYEWSE